MSDWRADAAYSSPDPVAAQGRTQFPGRVKLKNTAPDKAIQNLVLKCVRELRQAKEQMDEDIDLQTLKLKVRQVGSRTP